MWSIEEFNGCGLMRRGGKNESHVTVKETTVKCRVISPLTRERCAEPATVAIEFSDGDRTPACHDCALYLQELARSHSTVVKVIEVP